MDTLPDYVGPDLRILSIGLNPSLPSIEKGFYFANPRNRFWRALNESGLVPVRLEPGPGAMTTLLETYGIGFTDVVKRPSAGGTELRAADYRRWCPQLRDRVRALAPRVAWFHGKQAYGHYLRYGEEVSREIVWGVQAEGLGSTEVFVTPNPSPANAAFSLEAITDWYRALAERVANRES